MNRLTVSFDREWIEELRKNGKRVIRTLEKWIATLDSVSLKSSFPNGLTLELPPAERDDFLKKLVEKLSADFETSDPWSHLSVSGDTAGIEIPETASGESAPAVTDETDEPSKPECPSMPQNGIAEKPESEISENPKVEKKTAEPAAKVNPRTVVDNICSRVPVKHSRELETYIREISEVIPMLRKMGAESSLWHQHLLIAVDAGYGRSEFIYSMAELYKTFGLVKDGLDSKSVREFILLGKGREREEDGYRVTWDTILEAAQNMARSNSRNGISKVVLYIDISAWQSMLDTMEFKIRLRRLNSLCGSFLVVFRVPFIEGHVLRETSDALNDILNVRTIAVPPAPVEAMLDYAGGKLALNGFKIAEEAMGTFEQIILREKFDDSFFGYKTMDKVVQNMIYNKALSNCRRKEEDRTITVEDIVLSPYVEVKDDPNAELKKLIGMDAIERRIREVIVQIKTQRKLTSKGKKVARPSIHMLFTGNPGTGKTTVARILGRMMHQEGILRKGHFVEVKGRDLCGQYVGETAPKTSAICRDAYGSVLFIDEAYSLFRPDRSAAYDYGREALDTLVAEMDNHRDDLCVIMAGYKEEMEAMLGSNVGLKGRIPYEINFPNYTREELEKIFFSMLNGTFEYEEGLEDAVHDLFAGIPEETFLSREFSNARMVRNLFERTWGKAAYRQHMDGGEIRILKSDLAGAMSDNEFKKLLKKNTERVKIGFGA